ncbi:MAG: hypothetical protein P9M03_07780 [Candidatus Theseobacter exili]|nr:hypothetical protein [Candidatus Theseobacter exili]
MSFGFGRGRKRGGGGFFRGSGRGGANPAGPPGNCICPQCGKVVVHTPGVPCYQSKCLGCGSSMTRRFFNE